MKPSPLPPPEATQSNTPQPSAQTSDHSALQDRYRELAPLGQGGNASVLRAFDAVREQWVALKRLRTAGDVPTSELAKRMLETEYHTLRQVQHPSIIEVYDYGIDRELGSYYTMELLSGEDLQTLSPLPWRDACRLLMGVASSLAVVHSRRLVHRDVTARNVRRTEEGSAKLIDFGALTQMGPVRNIAGTPPYVPPEAICQQPLDGRADLYSLGALAYFTLTGRHAFPARDFAELRQLWHSPPFSLRGIVSSIPEALNELVMALLDPNVLARPQSAAEVMVRLSAIADLPLTEAAAVEHAYLAAPRLVARDAALVQARTHLLRAARGQSHTLLLGGAAGMGRSRMLDACVLDAELAGALVLRADATDGTLAYGVLRRLVRRLLDARPGLRARASELGLDPLVASGNEGSAALPRRDALIAAGVRLLAGACSRRVLAIAVDDAHAIDEPSLACLASLAEDPSAQRLILLLSRETGAPLAAKLAWDLLEQRADRLELAPLEATDARLLLTSVFGEVPQLDMLATLLNSSARGNPRDLMDAAQRIVDAQLVRYSGGQWFITAEPARISACLERPSDVRSRLAQLPAAGRVLLALLALDRDHRLREADYAALCPEHDVASLHWALNDLLRERWLVRAEDAHHFVRASDQRGVEAALAPEHRATLHLGIARHLESSQRDPVYEVYHFVQGQRAELAHAAMARYIDMADKNPQRVRAAIELDMVERMVELGASQGWPLPLLTLYRMQSMLLAAAFGIWERALPQADATLQALSEFAGLRDYHALAQLPAAERLQAALGAAQERFAAAAPGTHPLPPINAVRALTRVSTIAAASAYWMTEPGAFDRIPSLAPLLPLSPALSLTERIVNAFRALVTGQEWTGWDAFKQLFADVRAMPEAQLDARNRYTLELVVLSPVCFRDARHAAASTLQHCAALAAKQPDQAQNYAMLYHMVMGDAVAAEHARGQCELSTLRAGATSDARSTRLQVSSILFPLTSDLMALKRLCGELEEVRQQRPGWRFGSEIIAAHALRCQGKLEQALLHIERTLAELPAAHLEFAPCAQAHVWILSDLGQHEAAVSEGMRHRDKARALDIPTAWLDVLIAEALSRTERHDEAERLWQDALTALQGRAIGGVHLGFAFEVGARVARARGDMAMFGERCDQCAQFYLNGSDAALAARYRRLIAEPTAEPEQYPYADVGAVHTALSQCGNRGERAAQASALLRDQAQSSEALIFGIRAGRLEPLDADSGVDDAVLGMVQSYLTQELAADSQITRTAAAGSLDDLGESEVVSRCEIAGCSYMPVLLHARDDQGPFVVGVALLRSEGSENLAGYQRLVPNLSKALLALGDVELVRRSG
ncbi:MAG TPA: protein kinase [Polyangiales bacterium]|nr:protein kinase [Polyangiales bacterium]